MDWSLVLASQSIEVAIERLEGRNQWLLLVSHADHTKALDAIRLYRLENRRWAWRQQVPGSELIFHWGAVVWVFVLSWVHAFSGRLQPTGSFATHAFRNGEWWRPFTAVWLHADLGHFAGNALLGALVIGLAMARYGSGLALLLSYLAGVAGNFCGAWIRLEDWQGGPFRPGEDYIGVGASGMVMGAIGLLGAQSMSLWRHSRHATRTVLGCLMGGAFLFLTFGSSPNSDIVAHAGGFAAGVSLGAVATLLKLERWNRSAGTICLLLALCTWLRMML